MKKKKIHKIAIMIVILISGISWNSNANNVRIDTQPVVCKANYALDYAFVRFDISWDNSWRSATNWDAAWVFVKYKVGSNGTWNHAYLSTTGSNHSCTIDNGTPTQFSVGTTNIAGTDRGMGAFIYRSSNGTGSNNWDQVMLRWNYGENGVNDNDTVTVKVFAIEMCYVSQGTFSLGNDTILENPNGSAFRTYNTNTPYTINSQGALALGPIAGQLFWSTSANSGSPSGPTNTNYPTGYNAFYCMKNEISQEQYVDFLNVLTRAQQARRVWTNIASPTTSVTNVYVMSSSIAVASRNSIRCPGTIDANAPVTFFCDYNGNGAGNDADDGQTIACNDITWMDLSAYLDWSGLRPMTELEFEKACRGTLAPVAGEGAWGSATLDKLSGVSNSALETEVASNTPSNCHSNSGWAGNPGPVRCGAFALAATNRTQSGASYYGILDLSGNLWERIITIGNNSGRAFTGNDGDGTLDVSGDHDVTTWPDITAVGIGLRGGAYSIAAASINFHISARGSAANGVNSRNISWGGRGVRTAP